MNQHTIDTKTDRIIQSNGREYLYFSGTNYLGVSSVPEYEALVIAGIRKYGLHHGSSRSNNVQLEVFEKFEKHFAEKAGAEAGLLFSSGFLAGTVAVHHLKSKADMVIPSPDTHPAIQPEGTEPTSSMDFQQWINYCLTFSQAYEGKHIAFVSNAVDPLDLKVYSFDWINELSSKNRYTLLIDDSHAFGVLGKEIYGTFAQWKSLKADVITCGSLGKGLGIPGGIVLGPQEFIEELEQHIKFRTASPPPPAFYEAYLHGKHFYSRQQEKLMKNIRQFRELIKELKGIHGLEGYPVFVLPTADWAEHLEQKGIIVSSFPYPHPNDPPVNRIVLSGFHTEKDLKYLSDVLHSLS
jgi:8-amino-7-oxononanoate synthase